MACLHIRYYVAVENNTTHQAGSQVRCRPGGARRAAPVRGGSAEVERWGFVVLVGWLVLEFCSCLLV